MRPYFPIECVKAIWLCRIRSFWILLRSEWTFEKDRHLISGFYSTSEPNWNVARMQSRKFRLQSQRTSSRASRRSFHLYSRRMLTVFNRPYWNQPNCFKFILIYRLSGTNYHKLLKDCSKILLDEVGHIVIYHSAVSYQKSNSTHDLNLVCWPSVAVKGLGCSRMLMDKF